MLIRPISTGAVSTPVGRETPAPGAYLAYRVRQLSVLARPVSILTVQARKPLTMRVALAVRIALIPLDGLPGAWRGGTIGQHVGTGMNLRERNNVQIEGSGDVTLILSHGFGCDQSMWRLLLPHFSRRYRVVTYDLVGAGGSDLGAYDYEKYASLWGYAADLDEIIEEYRAGPVIVVGHSVSAMIAVLAEVRSPGSLDGLIMIGGSPCYTDTGTYTGGFSRDELHELLAAIDDNFLGWSSTMAPVLMGAPGQPALAQELQSSFCRTDAQIARHFARVIFLSDHRQDVAGLAVPTLILQSAGDPVAPLAVGDYLHDVLPDSQLSVIDNMGHYPQLSAPSACSAAIDAFLQRYGGGHE